MNLRSDKFTMNKLLVKVDLYRPSTYIDSFKLSGAIVNAMLTLYGSADILEPIKTNKLLVSDIMNYKNEPLFYLTKIPKKPDENLSKKQKIGIMKTRKSLQQYFNFEELKRIVHDLNKNPILVTKLNDNEKSKKDTLPSNFFESEMGVNINNKKVFTKNYNSKGSIHYNNGFSGDDKWFLILYDDKYIKEQQILSAIRYLSDVGISGRQSTGKGLFNFKIFQDDKLFANLNFDFNREGYYYLSSAFIPENESIKNIDFKRSYYSIDVFSGRDIDGKILGIYRYFNSGSLLYLKDNVQGRIIQVSDNRLLFFTGPIIGGFTDEVKSSD